MTVTKEARTVEHADASRKPSLPKPVCQHVYDHAVCSGRGAAFNIYTCRYCGDEEWL